MSENKNAKRISLFKIKLRLKQYKSIILYKRRCPN